MENLTDFIKEKKTIFGLIILALILLSLPLTIKLAQDRQVFKSRAEESTVVRNSCGIHKDLETWWDSCFHDDTDSNTYKQYQYICSDGTTSRLEWRSCPTLTPTTNPGGSDTKFPCETNSSLCTELTTTGVFCSGRSSCIWKHGGVCWDPNTDQGRDKDSNGCIYAFDTADANSSVELRNSCSALGCGVGSGNNPTPTPTLGQNQGGVPTPTRAPTATPTKSANVGRCPDNPPGTTVSNPGLVWRADCSKSCDKQPPPDSVCPWSNDGYVLSKHSADTTAWCYGNFDGGAKCMQLQVKNPLGGSISCVGNPSCVYNPTNPQVALNTSWQGLKECWDLGGAGTTCNYVGADLCVKISSPAHNYLCEGDNPLCTQDRRWKLVASGGSEPNGKTLFPDGSLPRVPPSGGISWIRPNMVYEFALFEDGYTATKQRCRDASDTDCLDYQYKVKACQGKQITTKTINTGGSSSNLSPSPQQPQSSPTPSTKTALYRISTRSFTDDSGWQRYEGYPLRREDFDLGDVAPGTSVTVYVQFKSTTGQNSPIVSKTIKYIGPDPAIVRTQCNYSPTGVGTEVIIEGSNFGQKGPKSKVMFNEKEAKISSWDLVATSSASNTGSGSLWRVVADIKDKLQGGLPIPLFIETNEGRRAPSDGPTTCTINLTTLSFNAKSECRPGTDMAAENIKVQIKESAKGAKPIFNQNINLNVEGQPLWTPPALEVGKKYIVSIRGPKTLGHKVELEAKEGTNVLDEFKMLVGDIAPASSPDNRVNTLDYGSLLSQWTVAKDSAKSADFNLDKRVNSIDYACMRQNFNKNGEDFPD